MNDQDVAAILKEIVIKNSRYPDVTVSDEQRLAGDLGFDSLAFLLTVTDLEKKFQFTFPLEELDDFSDLSFGELVRLVRQEIPPASQQA